MATPSGQIGLSDVNAEFGCAVNTCISMGNAAVRTLAGVGGAGTVISMSDLQNKADRIAFTLTAISASTNNYDLFTCRGPQYVAGKSDITLNICPGVCVGSTSTGTAAFLVPNSFCPGDTICIVNAGCIIGRGGTGGQAGKGGTIGNPSPGPTPAPVGPQNTGATAGNAGSPAGVALAVCRPITLVNSGVINAGGGGGGGGGGHPFLGGPDQFVGAPTCCPMAACLTSNPQPYGFFNPGGGGGGGLGCGGASSPHPIGGSPIGCAGTCTTFGAGGPKINNNPNPQIWGTSSISGGNGGAGGAAGSSGGTGCPSRWGLPAPASPQVPQCPHSGGSGGTAGTSISGNPNITISGPCGTINGPKT